MTGRVSSTARARRLARRAGAVPVMLAAVSLVGCSAMPDAVNPVEWYRGAKSWITGDEARTAEAEKPIPGADQDFPKLSSVPVERPRVSPEAARQLAAARLIADRERAQDTDRMIRLQTDTAARTKPSSPSSASSPGPSGTSSARPSSGVGSGPEGALAELPPPTAELPSAAPPPPELVPPPAEPATSQASEPTAATPPDTTTAPPPPPALVTPPAENAAAGQQRQDAAGTGQRVATVQFAAGSSSIDAEGRRAITRAVEQYKMRGGTLHVIGGAAGRTRNVSPGRHDMDNLQVSKDRAEAVARELVRQGVDRNAIVVEAGADETMSGGDADNRRTVIVLVD